MKADKDLQKETQKQRDSIDDYLGSVMGLYAFAESACWDNINRQRKKDSKYSVPHIFSSEDKKITPDLAVQVDKNYGIVAEMKKHFNEKKEDQFEQIKKYDVILNGWWSDDGKISNHDIVLLSHLFSSIGAKDTYEEWVKQGNGFERNFSIVEFSYQDSGQKQNFVLRRMDGGKLSDSEHDENLRKTKIIPPQIVETLLSKYKFYDADPPLFHTLLLIYNAILPLLVKQEEFEEATGKKKKVVEISAEKIREMLQKQFLPADHLMTLPKLKWVLDALDFLEKIGVAIKLDKKKGIYKITIQPPPRKDLIEYFTSKMLSLKKAENKKTSAPNGQQDLFN
jgi:hypothetical protein